MEKKKQYHKQHTAYANAGKCVRESISPICVQRDYRTRVTILPEIHITCVLFYLQVIPQNMCLFLRYSICQSCTLLVYLLVRVLVTYQMFELKLKQSFSHCGEKGVKLLVG